MKRAHAAGLAGASVFRGIEGYGASNHIHTTRMLSLSDDLPIAVIIVDTPDAIAAFLPTLDELITGGGVFPWGTFVVNVTGSLLLGLITGAALYHGFRGVPRVILATGFCGAYTTFSTFTFETLRLAEEDAGPLAAVNVIASAVAGTAAAAVGLALAAAWTF